MSSYDRDYMRNEPQRGPAGPSTWSVVTWLIVINVAVYLVNNLLFFNRDRDWFGLSLESLASGRIWTLLTYQFIHAHLWHLVGNLVLLFFFGRLLLTALPPRHIVRLFLLGGVVGGLLQLGWNAIFGDANIIGASGSVLSIVFAATTMMPYQRAQFFLIPVSITMRQIAWILLAVNAVTLLLSFGAPEKDAVAAMAHFGGMFFGWLYIRRGWHETPARSPRPKRSGFGVRILRDDPPKPASPPAPKPSGKKAPFVTSDVDAILDKINEQGFQSLTEEEHRILQESSGKISRRIDGD